MHVDKHYNSESRTENDRKAIQDIREYLGAARFDILLEAGCNIQRISTHRERVKAVQHLNISLAMMAGISGYPFHAFARLCCFQAYREWMYDGEDPVLCDEQGFALPATGEQS